MSERERFKAWFQKAFNRPPNLITLRDTEIEMAWNAALKAQPTAEAVRQRTAIPTEESDEEFARQIEAMDRGAPSAEAVREACARACELGMVEDDSWDSSYWNQACENRAAAIRALDVTKLGGRDE